MSELTADQLHELREQWYESNDPRYEIVSGMTEIYRTQCMNDFSEAYDKLKAENKKLQSRIDTLEKYREEPHNEVVRLQNCNCELHAENIKIMAQNAKLVNASTMRVVMGSRQGKSIYHDQILKHHLQSMKLNQTFAYTTRDKTMVLQLVEIKY